jgi:2-polyprenyl-3-methyl-5-hydroxy-6-metoxy-1,4-benzoquinol methylase
MVRSNKLEDRIIVKGYVSEEEKLKLLQSSWVLVFPSLMEGWGLVAMEAAACGTPTVGFNVPGVKDAVKNGKSGFLASNKNDFIKKIIDILTNDKLRNELSKNSILWANKFSWEKSSSDFLSKISKPVSHFDKYYFSSILRGSHKRKFHPVYDFRISYILNHLKPKKLLDVGCGAGLVVNSLLEKNIDAYGMDISRYSIEKLNKTRRNKYFVGDILKIPQKSKSFDTVTCVDVLEHIKKEDITRAIKECARVSTKNIYFDITVLEDILFIFSDSSHISKYFSWQWKNIIQEALGGKWCVKRGPILPMIHHGIFLAQRL